VAPVENHKASWRWFDSGGLLIGDGGSGGLLMTAATPLKLWAANPN